MSVASQSPRLSGAGPSAETDLDLPGLGAALWRQKWKILVPTVLAGLIALAAVQLITPKYQSEARVLIESRDNVFLRPDVDKDVLDRGTVDPETVTSQVQLILSNDLAREVIDKLKLGQRPEFDPALKGISPIKVVLGMLGFIKNPLRMTPEERVLDAYYDRLTVFPIEKSRVIVIDFLSEDPELAAEVANAIADAYLARQRAAKQEQAQAAGQWLSGEIEAMRKKVADAEAKVEAFRGKSNLLVGPNNTTLSAQQLGDLTAQLATARAQKAEAESKAKLIRDMLRSGGPIESSDILNSELIRRLAEQRVTLRAQLAEQSSSLLDNHPRIKELKAQIADLDRQMRAEAETLARSLENDAKLASARMESLTATLDQLKIQAAGTNEQDVQLRALEREAKAQRDLLESYLAKYREATAHDTLNAAPAGARVISRATVSNIPAYPKKLPTVLIASLAAMVLSAGIVLTRELLAAPPARAGTYVPAVPSVPAVAPAPGAPEAPVVAEPPAEQMAAHGSGAAMPTVAAPPTAAHLPDRLAARMAAITRKEDHAADAAQTGEPEQSDIAEPHHASEPDDVTEPDERHDQPGETHDATPPADGVPVSALPDVAQALREAGAAGSRIAVLGAAHELDTGMLAIRLARALASYGRVALLSLGAGDESIRANASEPPAAGLAELSAGTASFGGVIARDRSSTVNLILSGRTPADRIALLSAPTMKTIFAALARSYDFLVVNAGAAWGPEMADLATVAPQALLLSDTVNAVTESARERLLFAGFEDVTVLVGPRSGADAAADKAAAA
jgi:uncharacterized protein involved in exopolysaccharide biosynthesis/Mrp family chromosome partitioning ATPase